MENIKQELKKMYLLRKQHMDRLNNWKKSQHPLTRAGMCADLAIIEAKIELLEKLDN